MSRWRAVLIVAATACQDHTSPVIHVQDYRPDAGRSGPDAPSGPRMVTGTGLTHHITDTGEDVAPRDFTGATIHAIDPSSSATYPPSLQGVGMFRIPSVPGGQYMLRMNTAYLAETASQLSFEQAVLGRQLVPIPTTTTLLQLEIANLAAWQTTDEIHMISAGSGLVSLNDPPTAGQPTAGATVLTGYYLDLSTVAQPAVVDSTNGDELIITQLSTQTSGGLTYKAVARSVVYPAYISSGGTGSVSANFITPPAASISVLMDRYAFYERLTLDTPADEADSYPVFELFTLPRGDDFGVYSDAPPLAIFEPGWVTDTSTIASTSWQIGDPYPTAWTRMVFAAMLTYRWIDIPSTALQMPAYAEAQVTKDVATVQTIYPVEPTLGPPRSPLIQGASAFANQTSVGLTPTLSWQAPALGQPTAYAVRVYRVDIVNNEDVKTFVAAIVTPNLSVRVPSGVLNYGNMYMFEFIARAYVGDAPETPLTAALPMAAARVQSNIMIP